jgi:hypothetical protein
LLLQKLSTKHINLFSILAPHVASLLQLSRLFR